MDLQLALRKAYYAALENKITIPGTTDFVPIVDFVVSPSAVKYPYIILGDISRSQVNVKNCRIFNVSITVDVVTAADQTIGREDNDIISGEVDEIILNLNNVDLDLSAYGYSIGHTEINNSHNIGGKNVGLYVYRRLTNYNHLINKI